MVWGINSVGNTWAKTHGFTGTPEYKIWLAIRQRCFTPSGSTYKYYGGRGITMCQEWRDDFCAFLRDMGAKPSPAHTLERLDVDGHYEPGNCVWATVREQARNRRSTHWVEFACRSMSLAEACELAEVPYATIMSRIHKTGLTFFQALAFDHPRKSGAKAKW